MDIGENCLVKEASDARLSHHQEVMKVLDEKEKFGNSHTSNFKVKVAYCGVSQSNSCHAFQISTHLNLFHDTIDVTKV